MRYDCHTCENWKTALVICTFDVLNHNNSWKKSLYYQTFDWKHVAEEFERMIALAAISQEDDITSFWLISAVVYQQQLSSCNAIRITSR